MTPQALVWKLIKMWAVCRAYAYARWTLRGARPCVVDVGARNGLQRKWAVLYRLGVIDATLFEPDPVEAQRLRAGGVRVVERALGEARRDATLYVYRDAALSSVRPVNRDALRRTDYGPSFDEVGRVPVTLHRLDEVIADGETPSPQFLKVDVQGFELEVLQGLGEKLHGVVGIELEAQFEEVYTGQATFQAIYDWLRARGFGLVALRPFSMHGDNVLEVDAFFARDPASLNARERTLRRFWCILNRIATARQLSIRGY